MALFSEAGKQDVEIVPGGLNLFGKDGSRYAIPIPATLSSVFYLPDGLLLKCKSQQSFHHSQVIGTSFIKESLYTYLTLTQHPYSDLYPLGSLNSSLWTSTAVDIIYASNRFPLIIGLDPSSSSYNIYLLRTNLEAQERDKDDLASLDPTKRDDLYGKHVSSIPLIVAERLYKIPVFISPLLSVTICVPSNSNELKIYMNFGQCIKIYTFFLRTDRDFPYKCFEETGCIEKVLEAKEVVRKNLIVPCKRYEPLSPSLGFFQKIAQEYSSYMYVLSLDNELLVYDGDFKLCCFSLLSLGIDTKTSLNQIILSIEITNPLIIKCLSALFQVLPLDLFNTLHADITQKFFENRIRSRYNNDPEKEKEHSSEMGIFSALLISLLKDGQNSKEKRPKIAYSNESKTSSNHWESLLYSNYHIENQTEFKKLFDIKFPSGNNVTTDGIRFRSCTSPSAFARHVFTVIEALHLLYEDLKLDIFQHNLLYSLADLLFCLVRILGRFGEKYVDYYLKDIPSLTTLHGKATETLEKYIEEYVIYKDNSIPSVYNWLKSVLKGEEASFMPVLFERTRIVCRIYECLSEKQTSSGPSPLAKSTPEHNLDTDLVLSEKFPIFLKDSNRKKTIKVPALSKYHKLIQVMIEEQVQLQDIKSFPPAFALPILEIVKTMQLNPPLETEDWPKQALLLINRIDIYLNKNPKKTQKIETRKSHFDQQYEQILQLELHRDDDNSENLSEYIFPKDLRMEEVHCILDVTRILKMRTPENNISEEHFETEKHNLLYKLCLKRASTCIGFGALTLGTSKASPTSASSVPQINFSALLPPNFETKMQMSVSELETREKDFLVWPKFHIGVATGLKMLSEDPKDYVRNRQWITYHRGEEESNEHAGFIMALGLLGQLEALHDLDIYRYLRAEQESIIIAIYLGTAASSLGSMDERIMRVLRISIAFLIPPFVDIEIKLTQEAASIMGFGLLYKCSGNRQVTEMLIVQLGRKALTNKDIEREGLSLAAGLALGMVNLASGGVTPGLEDLRIDERLIRLFEGGKRMAPPKILQTGYLMGESSKCSVTQEGENFVTAITAPGALLAYALIHLRSNNELAADKIEVPNTFYGLEWARPEHLMIKILAKNLIMFDKVQGTREWILSQVPSLIAFCFDNHLQKVYSVHPDKDIDFATIANCYVYCLSGAVLTLGFKYLGTNNLEVAKTIIDEILTAREFKTQVIGGQMEITDQNKNYIEKQTHLTALCLGCISLGLIMSGTGDVESFKIMKRIRKKVEGEYGFSMAIHMAIGFLFLGNCQYSFSSNDFSIAAILASVFPKFPTSPSDNRFHLQAFRHLYILALEKRLLITKDAETQSLVKVPLKIDYSDIGPVFCSSPVLLRPLGLCKSVEIVGKDYYKHCCKVEDLKKLVLYAKKKIESNDRVSCWQWIQDFNKVCEEDIETWLGSSESPEAFLKTYKEVIPRVFKKVNGLADKERSWLIISEAFEQNKQEIIPYLLGLRKKRQDLECVKIFYTKLHLEGFCEPLVTLKDLYLLYREKKK
ncbi:hypothetical protein SteCoe_14561 [Stentor coeruleus]|uniref:Anaphase-promoting complex subunit 1 middle domain-containing protein n=1 Tax=Stentor coeruleus TaxID=5963 RepID=A0A1R2C5Q1_9CILI|nr:hypothetical protein SteCoe_14561 [Stentor coeruleus]